MQDYQKPLILFGPRAEYDNHETPNAGLRARWEPQTPGSPEPLILRT